MYETNAKLLYESLTEYGFECVRPRGSFYMMVKSPGGDTDAFIKKAIDHNIIVVPGADFMCPEYFRIAYCVPTEMVERSLEQWRKLI